MSEREEEGHEQDDDQDDQEREEDDEEEDEEGENDEEEEDDEDDDDAPSMPHSLSLQMQELFGGLMPSGGNRFRTILANLKSSDDPTMQLIALQELAEILSVSSEDTLAGSFSNESFVKELVRIMKGPEDLVTEGGDMDQDMMLALAMSEGFGGGNPEVMLLACRCICNLLDAMPTAVTSVVFHGAIRVLCQKLKSIQYIDLAEQALYVSFCSYRSA
jgi:E3 ubiquitin-protein ligase TRIP12